MQYNSITKLKIIRQSIKNPPFLAKTLYIFATMVYNIVTTDILFYQPSNNVDEEGKKVLILVNVTRKRQIISNINQSDMLLSEIEWCKCFKYIF